MKYATPSFLFVTFLVRENISNIYCHGQTHKYLKKYQKREQIGKEEKEKDRDRRGDREKQRDKLNADRYETTLILPFESDSQKTVREK